MLRIYTLGGFRVFRGDEEVQQTAWGREKAVFLIHLLVARHRAQLHKEQIIDLLWPEQNPEAGDRDFKVALNAVQKALEPDRPPRAPSKYVRRLDLTYGLAPGSFWLDAEAFEDHIEQAGQLGPEDQQGAMAAYRAGLALYQGPFLPERRYEDWAAGERERLQTLALAAMTRLAELTLPSDPVEAIRLAQEALSIDPVWENATRVLMRAFMQSGNRPMALRAYESCRQAIRDEFGLEPLPETRRLYEQIMAG
jgi:DNA-binding SARP family transcriptional activator